MPRSDPAVAAVARRRPPVRPRRQRLEALRPERGTRLRAGLLEAVLLRAVLLRAGLLRAGLLRAGLLRAVLLRVGQRGDLGVLQPQLDDVGGQYAGPAVGHETLHVGLVLVAVEGGPVAVDLVEDALHGRVRHQVNDVHQGVRLSGPDLFGGLLREPVEVGVTVVEQGEDQDPAGRAGPASPAGARRAVAGRGRSTGRARRRRAGHPAGEGRRGPAARGGRSPGTGPRGPPGHVRSRHGPPYDHVPSGRGPPFRHRRWYGYGRPRGTGRCCGYARSRPGPGVPAGSRAWSRRTRPARRPPG